MLNFIFSGNSDNQRFYNWLKLEMNQYNKSRSDYMDFWMNTIAKHPMSSFNPFLSAYAKKQDRQENLTNL